MQPQRKQFFMLSLLHDEQVARKVFPDHEPAFSAPRALSADSKPAALSERIIHEPIMPADHLPGKRHNLTRLRRQILHQKAFKVAFSNEADSR